MNEREQKKSADLAEQVKEPGGKGGLSLESAGRTVESIGKNREGEELKGQGFGNTSFPEDRDGQVNQPDAVLSGDLTALENAANAYGAEISPTTSLSGAGATTGMGDAGTPLSVTGEGIRSGPGNPDLTGGINDSGFSSDAGQAPSGEDWELDQELRRTTDGKPKE